MNVKKEIMIKLEQIFPGIPRYSKTVEQGFSMPCFFVKHLGTNIKKEMMGRYLSQNAFAIEYHNDSEDQIAENIEMAYTLGIELETIYNGEIRGINTATHIKDGVLIFVTNYDFRFIPETSTPKSKMAKIHTTTKYGANPKEETPDEADDEII